MRYDHLWSVLILFLALSVTFIERRRVYVEKDLRNISPVFLVDAFEDLSVPSLLSQLVWLSQDVQFYCPPLPSPPSQFPRRDSNCKRGNKQKLAKTRQSTEWNGSIALITPILSQLRSVGHPTELVIIIPDQKSSGTKYLWSFYIQVNTIGSYFNACICLWDIVTSWKDWFLSPGGRLNTQFGELGKKLKLETVFPIVKWSFSDVDNFHKKVRTIWTDNYYSLHSLRPRGSGWCYYNLCRSPAMCGVDKKCGAPPPPPCTCLLPFPRLSLSHPE